MKPHLALWAKTSDLDEGPRWHSLPYHLLDVAAVAEQLLVSCRYVSEFCAARGIDKDSFSRFLLLLVALHDIGKASAHFQFAWTGAADALEANGFGRAKPLGRIRHGEITAAYLEDEDGPIASIIETYASGLLSGHHGLKIITPIAGHHGRPVGAAKIRNADAAANKPFRDAATMLTRDLAVLFDIRPLSQPLRFTERQAAGLSWFLSALIPVADWIGSKQQWFAPRAPDLDLGAYWQSVARPLAIAAVRKAGIVPASIAIPGADATLPGIATPTPLQRHLRICVLPDGPALVFIEDATGSGKTEAALTLAHRLMHAGRASGFYFALPTTATADAMFARLAPGFEKLFTATDASLSLLHGRAHLPVDDETPVAAFCADWIADDRRKGFLAQGGVGTIDQALLAILPAKYQSLRVFGLQDKVLIVDEAHAFDAYVLKELATLIELHATLGGTTIIMSATLPLAARQKLAQAHQRGLGCREFARLAGRAYPMVTTVTSALHAHELPLDLAERSRRNVAVERIARVAEAEDMVVSLARNGAAVAMIRSTVDAAIESYERLCGHLGSERVELLHSRFLPEHRGRIETAILSRFGKASTPDMRQGRVVVATQVIEQSLDLDFDALVTDIAPIDLLIQRAGRLWRHTHRAARTVLAPVLHVISPSPTPEDAAGWLDATLKEASWVYRDTGRLWLTARRLFEAGEVILTNLGEDEPAPTHARRLVDAVYEGDQDLPTESLRQASARAEGIEEANKTIAVFATLNIGAGYVADSLKWEAEGSLATRLEEPKRVNVRLGVRRNGAIVPISEVPSWASSQISVTEFWARDLPVPDDEQKKSLQPAWSEADEGCRLLILTEVETGYCDAAANFLYSDNIGLLRRSPPTKK